MIRAAVLAACTGCVGPAALAISGHASHVAAGAPAKTALIAFTCADAAHPERGQGWVLHVDALGAFSWHGTARALTCAIDAFDEGYRAQHVALGAICKERAADQCTRAELELVLVPDSTRAVQ